MRRLFALLLWLLLTLAWAEGLEVHFIDVGQGDAVFVRAPTGQTLLYDGGRSRDTVLEYLQGVGVESLDLVVASHPDADHIGGLASVVRHYQPGFFMDNGLPHTTQTYAELLEAVAEAGSQLLDATGQTIGFGDASIRVLPPPGVASWGNNENSVGLIIRYGDFGLGLSGDAEHRQFDVWGEWGVMEPVTVYKSSHHGSPRGDNTMSMTSFAPEVVVISVGTDNPYGHPAEEILALYHEVGATLYRTDLHGTVVVYATEDGAYTVVTEHDPGCLDINSASEEELSQIIHLGESRAAEAVTLRPFAELSDLTRVTGISELRFEDIVAQGLACVP